MYVTPGAFDQFHDSMQRLNHRGSTTFSVKEISETFSSTHSQSICPHKMCPSWMRAVSFDGIRNDSWAIMAMAPPSTPVNATVNAPSFPAASSARQTFLLLPEVEMPTNTSPAKHNAST